MTIHSERPILVIGASGMLGRPVARRLIQDGFHVRGLARDPHKARRLLSNKIEIIEGNLKNVDSIDKALQGCQAVYITVDTLPKSKFHPETEGLKNVITACKYHQNIRLLVLSAYGINQGTTEHPWWHIREKVEAQQIAMRSGLPWTIFEPTWFLESIPLFIKGTSMNLIKDVKMKPYWIAGDDFGRFISKALRDNIGVNEIVPVQGLENLTLDEAAQRFISVYNPYLKIRHMPFWFLRGVGLFSARARDLATILSLSSEFSEPTPDPALWEKWGKPSMNVEAYAGYVRGTGDLPQK